MSTGLRQSLSARASLTCSLPHGLSARSGPELFQTRAGAKRDTGPIPTRSLPSPPKVREFTVTEDQAGQRGSLSKSWGSAQRRWEGEIQAEGESACKAGAGLTVQRTWGRRGRAGQAFRDPCSLETLRRLLRCQCGLQESRSRNAKRGARRMLSDELDFFIRG